MLQVLQVHVIFSVSNHTECIDCTFLLIRGFKLEVVSDTHELVCLIIDCTNNVDSREPTSYVIYNIEVQ